MNVRDAAAEYIRLGLQVVPLQGKACIGADWKTLQFAPEDFRDGDNIGIKNGNGIIDVDCDAPEACVIAPAFMPPTTAVYGRPSKPNAHYLYRGKLDKPLKFMDLVANSTIIELRVDHQSMAPPSIHPNDGEMLAWSGHRSPADITFSEVEDEQIIRPTRLTATGTMVARYYQPEGARHEWMLALAGTLRYLGLTEPETIKVVTEAAHLAKDQKLPDRLREVQTTFAKAEDDAVSGPKTLVGKMDTIGEKFVQSLRKIWGKDASTLSKSKMDELNERHAVIFQQSGDLVIITEDQEPDGRFFLRFSSPETFKQLYPEQVVVGTTARGTPILKKLGAAWFESPRRRFFNGIELAPNGQRTPGYYNMWRGFHFQPKKGDWSLFKRHLHEVVCSGVQEYTDYLMAWMANCVQEPGYPGQICVTVKGGQGTGKGFFFRNFGELFGVHYIQLDSTRQLTGNFNAHLHNAIFVFADEASWPGNKAATGALKRLITEPTLSIERKGMDIMIVPNRIHLAQASNEDWVCPAEIDERRYFVLEISKKVVGNYAWFAELSRELKNGGWEAMLYDLLEYKSDVNVLRPPDTEALRAQKTLSYSPEQAWWFNLLMEHDELWREKAKEKDDRANLFIIPRRVIYDNYVEFMKTTQPHRVRKSMNAIYAFMQTMCPEGLPAEYRYRAGGKLSDRYWLFPPINALRDHYDALHHSTGKTRWPYVDADMQMQELM